MWRLISNLVQRSRTAAVFAVLLMLLLWVNHWVGDPTRAFGFSMGVAFGLGPLLVLRHVPRPIWYLPVARRDVWRAAWLVATAGAVMLTTAVKLLALLAFPTAASYGLASVMLSSVYDLAFAGVGCGLVVVATRRTPFRAPWRQLSMAAASLADLLLTLGMIAAIYVVLFTDVLPTRWGALTPVGGVVLVTTLLVTIATWFHTPSPPARIPDGSFMFTAATPSERPRQARRPSVFGRRGLWGLPRLLAHEYLWTLVVAMGMLAGTGLAVSIAAGLQYQASPLDLLHTGLLLLDDPTAPSHGLVVKTTVALLWLVFVVASLAARFPAMLRHMRVLPLSARRVNLLLVAWPAVVWTTIWAALFALHSLATGQRPASLHLALLVGAVGLSAIVQSLTLRLAGVVKALAFGAAIGVVPFLLLVGAPAPGATALLGIAGLAGAAILNRAALRRSSTYRTADSSVA